MSKVRCKCGSSRNLSLIAVLDSVARHKYGPARYTCQKCRALDGTKGRFKYVP